MKNETGVIYAYLTRDYYGGKKSGGFGLSLPHFPDSAFWVSGGMGHKTLRF